MLNLFNYAAVGSDRIKNYHFWEPGNDHQLLTCYFEQKLNYIHQNPVVAQVVSLPEHYKFSSAIDYVDGKGLFELKLILFSSYVND